jgi:hypothetical protein
MIDAACCLGFVFLCAAWCLEGMWLVKICNVIGFRNASSVSYYLCPVGY